MKTLNLALIGALTGIAALSLSAPAFADDHDGASDALAQVLAHERRDEDRARDQYRNPAETLAFFQVEPDHVVAEYGPGGGWYTRVLAPYVIEEGTYIAINRDSDGRAYPNRAAEARSKAWTERFQDAIVEMMDVEAEEAIAFETDEVPEDFAGSVDRVLIFRSMHGLINGNVADEVLRSVRGMLTDDGLVGVVQHRAKANASWDDVNPAPGYVRQADVVKLFEINGFELVDSSEVNANPNDPADWEGGVWTLPPVLRFGDENREQYLAIGESDRMTLLFRKAD
ncbi:MAG: hypothetical protein ABJP48_10235 [Erythrobacter sp.]